MNRILKISSCYILLLFCQIYVSGQQLCGGSFGDPVFVEDFGSTTTSNQILGGPLTSPASTSYQYSSNYPPNDGFYSVVNRSGVNNGWSWINVMDHTNDDVGRTGNMLVVNASYTAGEFYRRRVYNLCPNQIYRFSAWLVNLIVPNSNQIKPDVTFQIRDVSGKILGEVNTGAIAETGNWQNYFLDFRADAYSGDVDVVLINNAVGGVGNDIAIDDITFSPCGARVESETSIDVFSGTCDNSQGFSIKAKIDVNAYLEPYFIWQKSTDNGASWIDLTTASSTSEFHVQPGTYFNNDWYRFIVSERNNINVLNCRIVSESIKIKIFGYPTIPDLMNFEFCKGGSNEYSVPNNLKWYESEIDGLGFDTKPIINTAVVGVKSYWVSQVINGCEGDRVKVDFIIKDLPSKPKISHVSICQDQNASSLSAIGNELKWYSTETSKDGSRIAPIPETNLVGVQSYWVSQTINGCESERAEIKVTTLKKPVSITLLDTSICNKEIKRLDAGEGFINYRWNTNPPIFSRYLDVSETGVYSVTLTNANGCQNTQQIAVNAGDIPIITKVISRTNSLEVIAEGGNPPYFYSLNGVDWQEHSVFEKLKAGEYSIYVKSRTNSCTAMAKSAVLFVPNVITPNGDGKNDYFSIDFLEYFPNAKILISDRFGQEVFSSNQSGTLLWDGKKNGRVLPTSTYWYQLDLDDGISRTGWIFLKNRD